MARPGLILTGGGARAAYQVGVLRAIGDLLPPGASNPFPIVCGTSAGAINAAALAADASRFRRSARRLQAVWENFRAGDVYRSDFGGVARNSARWIKAAITGGAAREPVALLDNAPLVSLLRERIDYAGIATSIASGALDALAITCSGYTSGESVCFFQARAEQAWRRARRLGVPMEIGPEHLLASSALPFIFPAVRIHREFFGDGSMRQLAPVSPALHLGADRILVVAVGGQADPPGPAPRRKVDTHPTLAQIAGHAMNSIFLDSLEVDLERLRRINKTLALIPPETLAEGRTGLRHVDFMVITPSEDVETVALRHAHRLPRTVRMLFRSVGATDRSGSTLLSYLLFEGPFCRELVDLGYRDAMQRRDNLLGFLGTGEGWHCELRGPAREARL